jgi:pilus assembly protein Flp/PilA
MRFASIGAGVMKALRARFAEDEGGATSIEYALIAGVIALGIVASVSLLPTALNGFFGNVSTNLSR